MVAGVSLQGVGSPTKSVGVGLCGCCPIYITQCISRALLSRLPVIRKAIILLLLLTVLSLMVLSYYVANFNLSNSQRHQVTSQSPREPCPTDKSLHNDHNDPAQLKLERKVLVLVESTMSRQGRDILILLEGSRIKYKMEEVGKPLPALVHMDKGRFAAVVFERLESYLNMEKHNRDVLDSYCRDFTTGIIAFTKPEEAYINALVKGFPLYIHSKLSLRDYEIESHSPVLRLTKAGPSISSPPGGDWTVFVPNHTTYQPLSFAKMQLTDEQLTSINNQAHGIKYIPVVLDKGEFDGIRRVIFGEGFRFWLHRLLFIDALSYLSHGKLSVSLERFLLIDIDDIFVGKKGVRMIPADVTALLESQTRLRKAVPGFVYNLGFSGYYYQAGSEEENKGDALLLANSEQFWWFPHMWRHYQPHIMDNTSMLVADMEKNKHFAMLHRIPLNQSYAVAPHHSGVYPVHEPLYEAWRSVWGVEVTSTEEYPHLRPPQRRRGFTHQGIQVLPRQTCGLFTHTIFMAKYPNGPQSLDASIQGGELFQIILTNPVNVFMTHLSNYGNDRLAIYTFENAVKFIQCWTNLQIRTIPPKQLAAKYFDLYSEETSPVWRNPCLDKRHLDIWSQKKSCRRLPKFLVVGPQKTGTTALYAFLNLHPDVLPNHSNTVTFEEVQFFNGRNYFKGLDWYMESFPMLLNTSHQVLYEKSANYFDSDETPARAHALLPKAKIITIFIDPAKRAYSWYQHVRAHDDPTAMSYSFYEVLTADETSPRGLRELRKRCIHPGFYAQHLERWLVYYNPKQIMTIDGESLKSDPISIMMRVQSFLGLPRHFDYSKNLKYSAKKGFYCPIVGPEKTQCLGSGKGRSYPPMSEQEASYLDDLYRRDNTALSKLLTKMGRRLPVWLDNSLRRER